jgi:hypothetical protein
MILDMIIRDTLFYTKFRKTQDPEMEMHHDNKNITGQTAVDDLYPGQGV